MARQDSFNERWASNPAQFERPEDSLVRRGWAGGAAEEPPEAKYENWWHNRVDEALAEIEQNGALDWFADVAYRAGATVRAAGKNWIATKPSEGVEPGSVDDEGSWQELSLELASKADAEQGSDGKKVMTPKRTAEAIAALGLKIGTEAGTAAAGNDSRITGAVQGGDERLTDAREWVAETVPQAEAEAGTAETRRAWSARRVRQAVEAAMEGELEIAIRQVLQPEITGTFSCNGDVDNTITMTGIAPVLGLEIGDVIQLSGPVGGGHDGKLFTVESIVSDDEIIVNYEHAGNRANGPKRLPVTAGVSVTVKLISKHFNAPLGLGQAWLETTTVVQNVEYLNTTNRAISVQQYATAAGGSTPDVDDWFVRVTGIGGWAVIGSSSNGAGSMSQMVVPAVCSYKYTGANSRLRGKRKELR